MSRPSLIFVLVEDRRQQEFARRFLAKAGYKRHSMRFAPLPGPRGAGEQWVCARYAENLGAYRQRASRAKSALLVVIDADLESVDRRQTQLREAAEKAAIDPRGETEHVAHFIPRRNIETWILCLADIQVDEDTDYHQHDRIDDLLTNAADTFYLWTRRNAAVPSTCVPSLSQGIADAKRL